MKASTTAITQPAAITTMTGHGLSIAAGTVGSSWLSDDIENNVSDYRRFPSPPRYSLPRHELFPEGTQLSLVF